MRTLTACLYVFILLPSELLLYLAAVLGSILCMGGLAWPWLDSAVEAKIVPSTACDRLICHADAGLTSTLAMFPLETIRTRLAVDPKKYRNMLGAFQIILEAEGAGALYRVSAPLGQHAMLAWT